MPKRKSSKSREKDLDYYKKKIKKLEREISERRNSDSNGDSVLNPQCPQPQEVSVSHGENTGTDTPALLPEDWLLQEPQSEIRDTSEPQPGPSTSIELSSDELISSGNNIIELDTEILEILGDDPSSTIKYGPEIRNELASRLLHIAKEGLSKDNRKNLISKYPVPISCDQIDAPKINPEIKAAIADAAIKRDKGIEAKQKQMSSAISCLSDIINTQLNAQTKDNDLLQKLMDISRILCDLQHADSITRRNFILFSLKHDMTEHVKNTKIDTFLFGENLAETLKMAKAVNKSGVELKAEQNKTVNKYRGPAPRPLNRRAPPQTRRPPVGSAPRAPRSQQPAVLRAPFPAPPPPPPPLLPPHAHSLRTSSQAHPVTYPRRRY